MVAAVPVRIAGGITIIANADIRTIPKKPAFLKTRLSGAQYGSGTSLRSPVSARWIAHLLRRGRLCAPRQSRRPARSWRLRSEPVDMPALRGGLGRLGCALHMRASCPDVEFGYDHHLRNVQKVRRDRDEERMASVPERKPRQHDCASVTRLPFCACGCGRRVPAEHALNGWRMECLGAVGDELRRLQNLAPEDLGMLVAFLRDRGSDRLATTIIGGIPMDGADE